ncbi:hypothetical protein FOL47_010092 [Perkinsus chesapeaki]|uniref:Peptidase A2 domain-containing protein n=1 Tax=Perkinsus chesapeaki TaxID=330153 RepID=A0A7J6L4W2_PERCH|nr:hypothetical protein FOL47_010092 [Perkinsus chesapeaki]
MFLSVLLYHLCFSLWLPTWESQEWRKPNRVTPKSRIPSDGFQELETLPADLDRFHEWSQAQGHTEKVPIATVRIYFPAELREELRLEEKEGLTDWEEFRKTCLHAACTILDGGSLLCTLRTIKITKGTDIRSVWNRITNINTLLYPQKNLATINSKATESMLMATENPKVQRKVMKKVYRQGTVTPSKLLAIIRDETEEVDEQEAPNKRLRKQAEDTVCDVSEENRQGYDNKRYKPKYSEGEWKVVKKKFKIIIDSGASLSLITRGLLDSMGLAVEQATQSRKMASFTGNRIETQNYIEASITFPTGQTMVNRLYVVEVPGEYVWLGNDFLKKNRALVDYGSGRLRFQSKWMNLP